jgi:serine/threonine protein kinase
LACCGIGYFAVQVLLVLEFCEHGTLLEHVTDSDPESLDASVLLTYCHGVGCGLSYLSSRKIIHRDCAARNVLLGASHTPLVSDFGMSAAVSGNDDSDYASNYVKFGGGEFPVRWAAIEVLTEAKYSKASDV